MNGALFVHSPNLRFVNLLGNICISESFNHDRIVALSDEVTKQCATIDEPLLQHFISKCRNKADNELSRPISLAAPDDATLKRIHDRLEALTNSQLLQKEILQKFIQDEKTKDVQIQVANEKLQQAENEISQLKKQIKGNAK